MRRLLAGAVLLAAGGSHAADAARGAQLYMRTDADTRSCVSCHGPDPGLSHNNILRAADSPDTLTKVLNTVSQMGFLRSQLSDTDKADIAAFLGTVSRLNAPDAKLRVSPVTADFGRVPSGGSGAAQTIRLANPSAGQAVALTALSVTNAQVALSHDCPAELAPAASCDLQVRARPQATGLLRAAVSIDSPAFSTPVQVGVTAAGTADATSLLEWKGGPARLRFDATGAGAESRQALVLVNPGPMPAVMGLLSIVGPDAARFRIESSACAQGAVVVAGTSCEMVLVYSPSLSPSAQATLQLRSDQANPPSLRLEGAVATALPVEPVPVADAGGGCSTRPPGGTKDPLLALLAVLATVWVLWRPGPGGRYRA